MQVLSPNLWVVFLFCCPDSSVGKESACNAGDTGSVPGLVRSTGEGIGYPLQYSGLENSMDYIGIGVAKSQTQLSNFPFHHHFNLWMNVKKTCFFALCLTFQSSAIKTHSCSTICQDLKLLMSFWGVSQLVFSERKLL